MDNIKIMRQLRIALMAYAKTAPDEQACQFPSLFEPWKANVKYNAGDRIEYKEKLYKCVQGHTSQADWTPDITQPLWVVIDVQHAGTLEDPIPASRGMEYTYGKYYLDGEVNKIYLCSRVGEVDGGTIVLQYMPHELAGQYFDEAVS